MRPYRLLCAALITLAIVLVFGLSSGPVTARSTAQPDAMSEADLKTIASMAFGIGSAAGFGLMNETIEPIGHARFCDNLLVAIRPIVTRAQFDLDGRHERERRIIVSEAVFRADELIENTLSYAGCLAKAAEEHRRQR